ncbi:unnamed protein product, partial [marine sediment metagenome]
MVLKKLKKKRSEEPEEEYEGMEEEELSDEEKEELEDEEKAVKGKAPGKKKPTKP